MLGNNVVAQYQAIGALLPLTDYFQKWSEEAGSDVTADFWPGDTYYYKIGRTGGVRPLVSRRATCGTAPTS